MLSVVYVLSVRTYQNLLLTNGRVMSAEVLGERTEGRVLWYKFYYD